MKDRNVLIDAILTAFENPDYQPVFENGKVIRTFCNLFCNEVAQKYECKDLWNEVQKRPKTADEIFDHVVSHPSEWQEIQCANLAQDYQDIALKAVQFWANSGSLVFAVASSQMLESEHGHICIVRPGTMKDSGKWGKCPAVANVGAENFIALGKRGVMKNHPVGLNEAFVKMPRFFVWRGL